MPIIALVRLSNDFHPCTRRFFPKPLPEASSAPSSASSRVHAALTLTRGCSSTGSCQIASDRAGKLVYGACATSTSEPDPARRRVTHWCEVAVGARGHGHTRFAFESGQDGQALGQGAVVAALLSLPLVGAKLEAR